MTDNKSIPEVGRLKAKVVDFLPFGATVEFESGFRALVHASEVSWTVRDPKAQDFLHLGQEIEVVIQSVDKGKRRIHASYRQTVENPWTTLLERFPIGAVTNGTVVSVRDFGALLMLPDGCIGLLHRSHFPKGLPDIPLGERVSVVLLEYDAGKRRIVLGLSSPSG